MIFGHSVVAHNLLIAVIVSQTLSMMSLGLDSERDLLNAVSEEYESMVSYEFEGHQVVSLPNTDCKMEFPFQVARGERAPGSAHKSDSSLSSAILFHGAKFSKSCLTEVKKLGFMTSPGWWMKFSAITIGVTSIRELPREELRLPDQEVQCVVLEVQYDDYTQKIKNFVGPVRYWIEPGTRLIRRVEFSEASAQGLRPWTVTVEKIKIGGEPPSWLHAEADPYARPVLVGKSAPDFELHTSDGQKVHLADLRGRVVLLDFWATWCTACEVEIPILEKLQAETIWSAVVLGITDEDAIVVREWLEKYHRSFRTLADGKATSETFGIKSIPVLVVIDRRGVVRDYVEGIGSESRLRRSIKEALAN